VVRGCEFIYRFFRANTCSLFTAAKDGLQPGLLGYIVGQPKLYCGYESDQRFGSKVDMPLNSTNLNTINTEPSDTHAVVS
jgi:hypothetical protein